MDEGSPPAVRGLRRALLQVEQMMDARYLNPPLGDDDGTKKARQKAQIAAVLKGGSGSGANKSQASSDDDGRS